MKHTPEGETAFHNTECASCGARTEDLTVAECARCGTPLPRPQVVKRAWRCGACGDLAEGGSCAKGHASDRAVEWVDRRRLIRAFGTSYRRMRGDRPASTLTTRSGTISSDVKGHPSQHRVLSLREILIAASVAPRPGFEAPWWSHAREVFEALPESTLRDVVGESIPPLVLSRMVSHLAGAPS